MHKAIARNPWRGLITLEKKDAIKWTVCVQFNYDRHVMYHLGNAVAIT